MSESRPEDGQDAARPTLRCPQCDEPVTEWSTTPDEYGDDYGYRIVISTITEYEPCGHYVFRLLPPAERAR